MVAAWFAGGTACQGSSSGDNCHGGGAQAVAVLAFDSFEHGS